VAKIKSKYPTAEDIPDGFGDLFTEHESGEWRLTEVEMVDNYGVNDALGALQKERNRAGRLEKDVKAVREVLGDLKPSDVAAALEELAELRDKAGKPDPEAAKAWEAKERQLTEKWTNQIGEKDKRIGYLQTSLHGAIAETAARAALTKFRGDQTLALPHVLGQIRMVEPDDGSRPVARVVDREGNIQISRKGEGEMTVDELVGTMAEDPIYSRLFDADGREGSGAGGGGSGGGTSGVGRPGRPRVVNKASEASFEDIAAGKVIVREWVDGLGGASDAMRRNADNAE